MECVLDYDEGNSMDSAIDKKVYKLINLPTAIAVSMDGSIWPIWVTTIVVAALVWVVGVVVE